MAVTFHGLSSAAGLKKLDEYLLSRSYISGLVILIPYLNLLFSLFSSIVYIHEILIQPCFRYQASKDDLTVYSAIPSMPAAEYVNVARWYKHIDALIRMW